MNALNSPFDKATQAKLENLVQPKHPGAICVVNYKGGVGKTTITCLLGYYLAKRSPSEKVLLFDIDPQCSLSLALGFDPDEVSKTELTVYNLVTPSKWTKVTKTNFENYAVQVKDRLAPKNLHIVRGSFDVDNLDFEIMKTLVNDEKRYQEQLFLYVKQMLMAYSDYKYVLIDCPPNKMFLTQAMLRGSSYYAAVTIPDAISIYGMPRLLRWVKDIPPTERPKLLGYVLNTLNRAGGGGAGMAHSQAGSDFRLRQSIQPSLDPDEKRIVGDKPCLGAIPRLDVIARFLGERDKYSAMDFSKRTSGQPSVDSCITELRTNLEKRIQQYNAKA
ncbi:MAG: ParA family protein [Verrucomicrobiota bacterium]